MPPAEWLDVVRHRVKGIRVPYLLLVQHHDISAPTRLVAPLAPDRPDAVALLAPRVAIDDAYFRVRLLDIAAMPAGMLGATVMRLQPEERHAVLDALDVILYGYPIGRR